MEDRLQTTDINSKGYGTIPKLVMQDQNISVGAKALYAYMCSYAGSGDICFPGRAKICADLSIRPNTYCRYLKELVNAGYVLCEQKKESGRFSHNIYTLCGSPCIEKQCTEKQCTKKPCTEKASTNNNSIYKINSSFEKEQDICADAQITPSKRFVPPTVDDVRRYCEERGNSIDPEAFVDYYTSNGWKVGKVSMKDWKAAVRTWEKKESYHKPEPKQQEEEKDPSYEDWKAFIERTRVIV